VTGGPAGDNFYAIQGAVNYENGSSNPTGYFNITENFSGTSNPFFTSISFEWLVVAQNCAKFGGGLVFEGEEEGEGGDDDEVFEEPYVVTLCDNKQQNGQDTFYLTFGVPGEVFWSTSFDPVDEGDVFDEGSVNITSSTPSEAPSFAPSTWPSHGKGGKAGSKKEGGKGGKAGSKKEGGKAGKAASYKEGGKAGKAGSYKEGGKAGKAGSYKEGGKAGKAGSYKVGGKAGKAGSYKEGGNVRGR
jgi:hypothetical protein